MICNTIIMKSLWETPWILSTRSAGLKDFRRHKPVFMFSRFWNIQQCSCETGFVFGGRRLSVEGV